MKLTDFKLLDEASDQIDHVLHGFNQTTVDYPRDKSIPELFEEIVDRWGDHEALIFDGQRITYRELDKAANKIAAFLIDKGVKEEDPVAIMVSPSFNMIIAMLGALKAGACYVPINVSFPFERISYILNDTNCKILLSEKKFLKELNNLQWDCSCLRVYACLDTVDIKNEMEAPNELMKQELWDHVGVKAHNNISGGGWVSSFTGEEFSQQEMDEYGDNIYTKLTPLLKKEMRVLEVGCSSGISMFKLSPLVKSYYGIDISPEILKNTSHEVATRGLKNIKLQCLSAERMEKAGEKDFDVIILNSVVQCFNGHNYLRMIIEKAIHMLGDEGFIFLGDIMDNDLKDEMISALQSFKKTNPQYTTKVDFSNELFISKAYLDDLKTEFSDITEVIHSKKIGTVENELSRFRYDTILKIRKNTKHHGIQQLKNKEQFDSRHLGKFPSIRCGVKVLASKVSNIMYTSGTSGRPKGIMIVHRGIVRLVKNSNFLHVTHSDTWLQTANIAFDPSTMEVFSALLNGARLCLIRHQDLLNVNIMEAIIKNERISIMQLITPLFNQLVSLKAEIFAPVKTMIVGGDAISVKHVKLLKSILPDLTLYNAYGPTENTVVSTVFKIEDATTNVPIGCPVSNSQCYIFNEQNELMPIGFEGELYLGGEGLAKGYLNDHALTTEKFIEHPYIPGKRVYKSGDKAKWLASGNIEFLGRLDRQVKIRGFRIELKEIEQVLLSYPDVREAIVQAIKEGDDNKLFAYIVADKKILNADIHDFLNQSLPEYMIPAHLVFLEKMPLTSSGKIDMGALSNASIDSSLSGTLVEPRNDLERILVELWKEVLGISKVGITDHFFKIGGHSLKATMLASRMEKKLDMKINILDLFNYPTIKELGEVLQSKQEEYQPIEIKPIPESEYYDISHAQKRLWLINQVNPMSEAYNSPVAFVFDGALDIRYFEKSFLSLIERHEILRTSFIVVNGEVKQKIHDVRDVNFKIEYCDLRQHGSPISYAKDLANDSIKISFDLQHCPLFRVKLYQVDDEKYVFLLVIHHIISDGWSMNILFNEVTMLYNAFVAGTELALPPLSVQYKDYAAWHNAQLQSEGFGRYKEYWCSKFQDEIPVLDLAADYVRPEVKTYEGSRVIFEFDTSIKDQLVELCEQSDVSIFVLFMSLFKVLLYRYTDQHSIVVGTAVAGRDNLLLENQLGFYVNTLALRTEIEGTDDFHTILKKVKQNTLEGYRYQTYPFDQLIEDLDLERDRSRSPLFDVMLILQNNEKSHAEMTNVRIYNFEFQKTGSQFDLVLSISEESKVILVNALYNTNIFSEASIRRMLSHLYQIASEVVVDPSMTVAAINLK